MISVQPFTIERTYDAPIEKVWNALTDKDQMKKWYFDLPAFEPVVGFEFQFYGHGHTGEQYLHFCKVTEVVPCKKFLSHSAMISMKEIQKLVLNYLQRAIRQD